MFFVCKKLHPYARLPQRAHDNIGDAIGYDCYSPENVVIPAQGRKLVKLGFAAAFDRGYGAFMFDRSGMGNKGIMRLAGVIEPHYRGEWGAILYNTNGDQSFTITPEKAIIQVVFLKVEFPVTRWVDELPEAGVRGEGGFGSTDLHTKTASELFNTPSPTEEQRRLAKEVNFGAIYGNKRVA